jgi:hypothetical protein
VGTAVTLLWIVQLTVLPWIVGRRTAAALAALGFRNATFTVRNVSLQRAVVTQIAGPADEPTVNAAVVTYSPWSLLRGRLSSIQLTGVQVTVDASRGAIWLSLARQGSAGAPTTGGGLPFEQIVLRSSNLVLRAKGAEYWLSVLATLQNDAGKLKLHAEAHAADSAMAVDGTLETAPPGRVELALHVSRWSIDKPRLVLRDLRVQLALAQAGGAWQILPQSRATLGAVEFADWTLAAHDAAQPVAQIQLQPVQPGQGSAAGNTALPATLVMQDASLLRADGTVKLPHIQAKLPLRASADSSGISIAVDPASTLAVAGASVGDVAVDLPQAHVSGTLKLAAGAGPSLDGMVDFAGAAAKLGLFWVRDAGGKLPVRYNVAGAAANGRLAAAAVGVKSTPLPGLVASAALIDGRLALEADWPVLKEASVHATGAFDLASGPPRGHIGLEIPQFTLIDPDEVGSLLPMFHGLSVLGTFSGSGQVKLEVGHVQPHLDLHAHDVQVSDRQYDLEIDGLSANATIDGFSPLTTPGGQGVYVSQAHVGKLILANGNATFRVESVQSLLIERMSCQWQGGNVYTDAFRIDRTPSSLDLTLSGEDLDLKSVLATFLPEQASGDGRMYGRLPVKIRWPQIIFGNGYLYSAPGGGTFQLGAKMLSQLGDLLDKSDPRFATDDSFKQVKARALEAMSDFQYDVLKIDWKSTPTGLFGAAHVEGKGRQSEGGGHPLSLTVNFPNMDQALTRYLIMKKQAGE